MSNTRSVVRLSDDSIVIQPKIHRMFLTEDRLKNILSRIYEDGVIDSNNFGWNNLGTTLLAVSGTLLLACLTSKFNDFSKYIEWATPTVLSIIAWVIFTVFFIVGIVSFVVFMLKKDNVFKKRDTAVEKCILEVKTQAALKQEEGK